MSFRALIYGINLIKTQLHLMLLLQLLDLVQVFQVDSLCFTDVPLFPVGYFPQLQDVNGKVDVSQLVVEKPQYFVVGHSSHEWLHVYLKIAHL